MHSPTTTASMPTVVVSSHGLPCTDVPSNFTQMMELAEQLATATDFLPEKLRGKPGNVLAVMLRARALDIPLAVAWDELYVIKGSIGQSARLVRGLARRAGHRIAYVEHDRFHAVALIQCAGEAQPHEVRFTIQEAISMGLTESNEYGKGGENWAAQPENMLIARVTTRAVTRYCPEVMLGLGGDYVEGTPEDLAADSDMIRAVREEHVEKVAWILRVAELTYKQGNGAVRLNLLRSLFMDARDGLVLDFAADPTGEYSVRQVLTEKMREADLLAKAQAAGTLPPVDDATGPCGLEDLLALLAQADKEKEAADPGDVDGPQDDPFPASAAVVVAVPQQEEKEAAAGVVAPAPEAPAEAAQAPVEEPEAVAVEEAPAPVVTRPAARPVDRAPARPAGDERKLPCGCTVEDVIRDGVHGADCLDRA